MRKNYLPKEEGREGGEKKRARWARTLTRDLPRTRRGSPAARHTPIECESMAWTIRSMVSQCTSTTDSQEHALNLTLTLTGYSATLPTKLRKGL